MVVRRIGYRCDCLPVLGPRGTLACELNDCDDFCLGASETCRGGSWSYVLAISCMRHRCQKLSEFRVQTATRIDKGVSAASERMRVLVAI